MTIVQVAVPVLQGRRNFHFDKGRPWSIVEHVLLAGLIDEPLTAAELAERGNIPKRVAIEALIRLMRAGWVEMSQKSAAVRFVVTHRGAAAATYNELPNASRRLSRRMNFVIDQVTGTVYRSRELPFVHEHVLDERAKRERIVKLERAEREYLDEVKPLVEALFLDDEKFISVDPHGDRLSKRWSLVTVRDGEPDGLTTRAPASLIEIIKCAAKAAPNLPAKGDFAFFEPPQIAVPSASLLPGEHFIDFSARDIILGGSDHRAVFEAAVKKARHRILIHSTFISENRFNELLHLLKEAVNRGVKVDILWGQEAQSESNSTTRHAVGLIRRMLREEGIEMLRVHPFSTGSHSKVLIADEGSTDKFFSIVGSCNWLSTQFQSFEASVRLKDPAIVADVVYQMAELSKGSRGIWTDFTNELAALAAHLRAKPIKSNGGALAQIVIGSRHADLVRQARDVCERRMFVVSHRFGVAGESAILAPALAAAKAKGVDVNVFYCTTSGLLGGDAAADMTIDVREMGVEIRPVRKPRIHAKILAWDDDAVVITSQNWLSADPPDTKPRQEIGVFIKARGLAKNVIERFAAAHLE
ncbi:phospholipase D-like domain-containing protein [Limibacillus halophilus]|uniref:Phospholipase D n=1 Tax=Limibacillus halophilus TaxID=1579333 RepID=A0A839SVP9_9PROT|nr:phospholipase D-like domain-containing protein [Limibacillus halophilus]MBB3065774.1 phosphatidylserine/phosphatidylglycerophosphate/cardiolipin synthase-like enzyme [Limibacillus halophilus]